MKRCQLYASALAAGVMSVFCLFSATNAAPNPRHPFQAPAAAPSQPAVELPNLPPWAYPADLASNAGGNGAAHSNVVCTMPGAAERPSQSGFQPAQDDGTLKHVPGSSAGFSMRNVFNMYDIPDWFPESHPQMPSVVSHGDKARNVQACGYCHLPNGQGRTENQSIAGLPAEYIVQQIYDIRNGLRKTSGPRLFPAGTMVREAQAVSDDEAKIAAAYFSSIKLKPWIRVVETDTVPKTKVSGVIFVACQGGTERIGQRIVELAEDQERFELRDSSSGFVAYVPTGSIKRGKDLVTTGGGGRTIPCRICHGADLKGIGNVPSIAGRSPSQMARQIIDIQIGRRDGPWAQLMKEPVRKLTNADIVAITAHLASLNP